MQNEAMHTLIEFVRDENLSIIKIPLNPTPIPELGKGWKIFLKVGHEFRNLNIESYYNKIDDFIVWDETFSIHKDQYDYGFCFFLTKDLANDTFSKYRRLPWFNYVSKFGKLCLEEINYKGGIQEQDNHFIIPEKVVRTSFCKTFRRTDNG